MAKQKVVTPHKPVAKVAARVVKTGPNFIEKNALKIAIGLAIVGLCIRLYRIGFLSLWVDEYMHALAAIHGHFKHGENNGILLTWFNTTFAFFLGNTEFSMRLPVALLGAALIPTVYVLGKNLVNYRVGLMAALLTTFSLYLIFWSRVDRPYGMVATFYVPLLICFWLMLERVAKNPEAGLAKFGLNKRYLLWLPLALILAMMSQLICFLFLFTAGFYGTFVAIESWVTKKSNPFKLNAYNVLFYLNIIAIVLMFTPLSITLMRPIIELFLPPNIATLILPDMKAVMIAFDGTDWLKSYNKYAEIAPADFKLVNVLGWLGFILALFNDRKAAYFLISAYVLPMLLMGFVFREPAHAKYLSYIYPVFLISAAYSLYFIAFYAMKVLNKNYTTANKSYLNICNIGFAILLLIMVNSKDIKAMLTTQVHGNVVPKEISEIPFVNWNQPCQYIKANMKTGDIIMATVQDAPKFYLRADSVVWFRQMHFDAKQKGYVPNLPDGRKKSAYTYDQLVKTFNENPRGWLMADYYFENALTDPRAKQFVEENFVYHFDACTDGAVKVFSWDKAKPKNYASSFVIELGKNEMHMNSQELTFTINKAGLPPKVNLIFLGQGIDSDAEAFVIINDKTQIAIRGNGSPLTMGNNMCQVDASVFQEGANKVMFAYNSDESNGDVNKGFVLYSMDIR
jgi:hypothetical protein